MAESTQPQKELTFNNFYDEDGNFSKDKLTKYLKAKAPANDAYKILISKLLPLIPAFILLLLIIIRMVTSLINNGNDDFYVWKFMLCVGCILTFIALEVIPLVSTSVSEQKKYSENLSNATKELRKQFDDVVLSECILCAQTKTPEPLNVYNLYTYKQIQQIERSLTGPNVEVYCYSRYRDDGGIGPIDTDKIVTENIIKKGIPYHFFYYEDSPGDTAPFEPRSRIETYVVLSDSIQLKSNDAYKQCLDYRIYSNARFDIMIYKRGKNLEGYFCLNFPVAGTCETCQKAHSKRCPLKSAKGSTDKLLYKKMPRDITEELVHKLKDFEKIYNKKDT